MSRFWPKLVLAVVLVIGLILFLDYLIETDQEAIEKILKQGLARVSAGDVNGVMAFISPDFDYMGRDRAGLQQTLVTLIPQIRQFDHSLLRYTIQARDQLAEAEFQVLSQPSKGTASPPLLTNWRIGLQKKDDKWLITEIDRQ